MKLKKTIRKLHLWLGLASGSIVFIVALTGCIYVFKDEIASYTKSDFDYVNAQKSSRVSLNVLIDSFKKNHTENKLQFIKQKESDPNATIVLGDEKFQVAYNPYNGNEVMTLHSATSFFPVILKIHRTLLLGDFGKNAIGISIFVFLFMLISGLVLWFPNRVRNLKSFFVISNKSAKRLNFDLHRIGGFYASFILVFITVTGLFFSYDFVKKTVFTFTLSEPYTKWGPNSGIQKLKEYDIGGIYSQIQKKYPNSIESSIFYPKETNGTIRVKLKYPYEYIPKYNTFFVDQFSGEILQIDLNEKATTAEKVKNSIYGIHTGSVIGIFGKIIVFFAAVIAASFPITGFMMWRRKKKEKLSIGANPRYSP